MNIVSRLKRRFKPNANVECPYGSGLAHKDILASMTLECWDDLPKETREAYINWAKQNLWNDVWAWRILRKVRGHNG
jgi:hypothetical protein